jgi:hypothetical protein
MGKDIKETCMIEFEVLFWLKITGFLDFVHRLEFQVLENTIFWKLDLCPSSDKQWEARTLLGLLERANLNHWTDWRLARSKGLKRLGVSLPSP